MNDEFIPIPGVEGVVLGGSRATGSYDDNSDIDIGIYYSSFNLEALNKAATKWDDFHRLNLVCREGRWGKWVNAGAWLKLMDTVLI